MLAELFIVTAWLVCVGHERCGTGYWSWAQASACVSGLVVDGVIPYCSMADPLPAACSSASAWSARTAASRALSVARFVCLCIFLRFACAAEAACSLARLCSRRFDSSTASLSADARMSSLYRCDFASALAPCWSLLRPWLRMIF